MGNRPVNRRRRNTGRTGHYRGRTDRYDEEALKNCFPYQNSMKKT